jgi:hypothetical protein
LRSGCTGDLGCWWCVVGRVNDRGCARHRYIHMVFTEASKEGGVVEELWVGANVGLVAVVLEDGFIFISFR